MAQERERKKYLDAAKGWGINMIMFGHISFIGNPVSRYFSSYKLALFFFVSGFLLCMTQSVKKNTPGVFLRRHMGTLMIPYVAYSTLILGYSLLVDIYKGKPASALLKRILDQGYEFITLRGHSTMWFLPCLFLAQMLFILVIRMPVWVRIGAFVLPVFSDLYFFHLLKGLKKGLDAGLFKLISYPLLTISKAILGFWFVFAGYLGYALLRKLFTGRNTARSALFRFLAGAVFAGLTIWLSTLTGSVDINNMNLGKHPLLLHLSGITGSIGTILVLEGLEKKLPLRYLSWSGKNSLTIMATHGTLGFKQFCIRGWTSMYGIAESLGLRFYLDVIGIQFHLALVECGVIALIDRFRKSMRDMFFGNKE